MSAVRKKSVKLPRHEPSPPTLMPNLTSHHGLEPCTSSPLTTEEYFQQNIKHALSEICRGQDKLSKRMDKLEESFNDSLEFKSKRINDLEERVNELEKLVPLMESTQEKLADLSEKFDKLERFSQTEHYMFVAEPDEKKMELDSLVKEELGGIVASEGNSQVDEKKATIQATFAAQVARLAHDSPASTPTETQFPATAELGPAVVPQQQQPLPEHTQKPPGVGDDVQLQPGVAAPVAPTAPSQMVSAVSSASDTPPASQTPPLSYKVDEKKAAIQAIFAALVARLAHDSPASTPTETQFPAMAELSPSIVPQQQQPLPEPTQKPPGVSVDVQPQPGVAPAAPSQTVPAAATAEPSLASQAGSAALPPPEAKAREPPTQVAPAPAPPPAEVSSKDPSQQQQAAPSHSQKQCPRKQITLPVTPLGRGKLITAGENAWKPKQYRLEAYKTVYLFKKVRSFLNKLTPTNFQKLKAKAMEYPINTEEILKGVIDLVFEKAISEMLYSRTYAELCRDLSLLKVPAASGKGMVQFRTLLINRCQKEFEKKKSNKQEEKLEREKIAKLPADQQASALENLELKLIKNKQRMLGNIRFIGELFKLQMLVEQVMHECIFKLLCSKDDESLECMSHLMNTIGKILDHKKAKKRIDQYFQQIRSLTANKKTSARIRFMLQDVMDLRTRNWIPRRVKETPKTIEQIRQDFWREKEQKKLEGIAQKQATAAPPPRKSRNKQDSGRQRMRPFQLKDSNTVALTKVAKVKVDPKKSVDPKKKKL